MSDAREEEPSGLVSGVKFAVGFERPVLESSFDCVRGGRSDASDRLLVERTDVVGPTPPGAVAIRRVIAAETTSRGARSFRSLS